MMCSAYRLNKQGDSPQPCRTPFSILNQSVVPYGVLTVASWPAYRLLRRQVRWSDNTMSLKAFVMIHDSHSQRLSHSHETEIDVFLKFSCFLYHPAGNLISSFSSFSKPSWDIWKFFVCIMLEPSMHDFKHDLTSMGDECKCPRVNMFFGITLLGNEDEDWPFPVLWPLKGLPDLLT